MDTDLLKPETLHSPVTWNQTSEEIEGIAPIPEKLCNDSAIRQRGHGSRESLSSFRCRGLRV